MVIIFIIINLIKNKFENIFMLSKFFANYYDCIDERNLFFGSPKFDINLDYKSILNKYKLKENNKFALIFYPKKRDIKKLILGLFILC